jgi:hypothetical protein
MNERIKELADRAKESVPQGILDVDKWIETYNEKFARLIVRECVNIVRPTQHHEAFAQSYLGDVDGLELLDDKVNQIKQHFGVENESI